MVDPKFPVIPDGTPPDRVKWMMIPHIYGYCQKVLPTIYDDSLSYYEVLCKMQVLLNHLIDNNNQLPQFVKDLLKEYVYGDEFKAYVEDLLNAITSEVNVKFPLELDGLSIPAAVGDGETDDTEAVQGHIDYVGKNGGRLYFPEGTYLVKKIALPEKISMRGIDRYSSILTQVRDTKGSFITGIGQSAVFRDLCFSGNYFVNPDTQSVSYNNVFDISYGSLLLIDSRVKDGNVLCKLVVGQDGQIDDVLLQDGNRGIVSSGGILQVSNVVYDGTAKTSNPFEFTHDYSSFEFRAECDSLPIVVLNGNNNRLRLSAKEVESMTRNSANYVENIGRYNDVSVIGIQEDVEMSGSQVLKVGSNQSVTVGGDRMAEVQGNNTELINGDSLATVKGDFTDNIQGNLTTNVEGKQAVNVGGDYQNTVLGNFREEIHGTKTQENFSSSDITNHSTITERTTGNHIETVTGSINQLATQDNSRRGQSVESIAGEPSGLPPAVNGTNLIAGQEVELFGNADTGVLMNQTPRTFTETWNYINYKDSNGTPNPTVYKIPVFRNDVSPDVYHNHWVTPEMFGAKGDGVTNDHDAIQAWLNSPLAKLTPNKGYKVDGNLTISGTSIIVGGGKLYHSLSINGTLTITARYLLMLNMHISLNANTDYSIQVQGDSNTFDNCIFYNLSDTNNLFDIQSTAYNCTFSTCYFQQPVSNQYIMNISANSTIISDCRFINGNLKFERTDSQEHIVNCEVVNSYLSTIQLTRCDYAKISGCTMSGNNSATLVGLTCYSSLYLHVQNTNVFETATALILSDVTSATIENCLFTCSTIGSTLLNFLNTRFITLYGINTLNGNILLNNHGAFSIQNSTIRGGGSPAINVGNKLDTEYEYTIIKDNYVRNIYYDTYPASKLILKDNYPILN